MKLPAQEIVSGLILLVIGTLLLTPGFITDFFGFLFLIPALRRLAAQFLVGYFKDRIKVIHPQEAFRSEPAQTEQATTLAGDMIIDVEAEEVE